MPRLFASFPASDALAVVLTSVIRGQHHRLVRLGVPFALFDLLSTTPTAIDTHTK